MSYLLFILPWPAMFLTDVCLSKSLQRISSEKKAIVCKIGNTGIYNNDKTEQSMILSCCFLSQITNKTTVFDYWMEWNFFNKFKYKLKL